MFCLAPSHHTPHPDYSLALIPCPLHLCTYSIVAEAEGKSEIMLLSLCQNSPRLASIWASSPQTLPNVSEFQYLTQSCILTWTDLNVILAPLFLQINRSGYFPCPSLWGQLQMLSAQIFEGSHGYPLRGPKLELLGRIPGHSQSILHDFLPNRGTLQGLTKSTPSGPCFKCCQNSHWDKECLKPRISPKPCSSCGAPHWKSDCPIPAATPES